MSEGVTTLAWLGQGEDLGIEAPALVARLVVSTECVVARADELPPQHA